MCRVKGATATARPHGPATAAAHAQLPSPSHVVVDGSVQLPFVLPKSEGVGHFRVINGKHCYLFIYVYFLVLLIVPISYCGEVDLG